MSRERNVQLRRDTRRVFQILMPQLPIQMIDIVTHVMFRNENMRQDKSPPKKRFVLKRVDSCNGLISLSNKKVKSQYDIQFSLVDQKR